jgi:hypothetical protein
MIVIVLLSLQQPSHNQHRTTDLSTTFILAALVYCDCCGWGILPDWQWDAGSMWCRCAKNGTFAHMITISRAAYSYKMMWTLWLMLTVGNDTYTLITSAQLSN